MNPLMKIARDEAGKGVRNNEGGPFGAVISRKGEIIAQGHNEVLKSNDPTAHAEIVALRAAAESLGSWNLEGCTLTVTLEPCVMCAGAILAARIPRVVFGAWDAKAGAAGSVHELLRDRRLPLRAEVEAGVLEAECAELLTRFFGATR